MRDVTPAPFNGTANAVLFTSALTFSRDDDIVARHAAGVPPCGNGLLPRRHVLAHTSSLQLVVTD